MIATLQTNPRPLPGAALAVSAYLEDPRRVVTVGGSHVDSDGIDFNGFEVVAAEPLEVPLYVGEQDHLGATRLAGE
ncbi:MAG: hypothetical protein JSW71_12190 [Gemmatimonadota bacterium]|nr:MAG: hypothetical protein JSW71_12190 [Gemmatimonadota bacterium]